MSLKMENFIEFKQKYYYDNEISKVKIILIEMLEIFQQNQYIFIKNKVFTARQQNYVGLV